MKCDVLIIRNKEWKQENVYPFKFTMDFKFFNIVIRRSERLFPTGNSNKPYFPDLNFKIDVSYESYKCK